MLGKHCPADLHPQSSRTAVVSSHYCEQRLSFRSPTVSVDGLVMAGDIFGYHNLGVSVPLVSIG